MIMYKQQNLCAQTKFSDDVIRDSSSQYSDSLWGGGPGIEFRLGAIFSAPVQTGPGVHPAPYTKGTGLFPVDKAAGA